MDEIVTITGPAGPIEVRVAGAGHPVVMIPSLGRGAADFVDLGSRLADTGRSRPNPGASPEAPPRSRHCRWKPSPTMSPP